MQGRRTLPDSSRTTIIDPSEKITLLENALNRERNAKKRLEQKLDQKAQIEFDKNQALINGFEIATSKHVQLQFLATLTKDLLSNITLDELFYKFSGSMSKLLEACPVFLVSTGTENDNTIFSLSVSEHKWQPIRWRNRYKKLSSLMLKSDESVWHRIEHQNLDDVPSLNKLMTNSTLLYLVIHLSESEQKLVILDISHFCYSTDFKQTLNIAAQQFTLSIKRRVTELELAHNNTVLNNTVIQLKSTQQQLVHSEKMGSLGQLSAGIAHEINNPIGYISSNLCVLKDYIALYNNTVDHLSKNEVNPHFNIDDFTTAKDDIGDLLDSCIEGVQRVTDIVASLKTFSRKEEDEFSLININEVLVSALKIVWNEFKYTHEIVKLLADNLPEISGNYGQLQQVFVNLFVNSAHAMKEGGQLTIQSAHGRDYVEINVHDTGCGMDDSVIRHLFEPFYTTKDVNEGTGLGLSVSYAIVEKHNAMISVNSEPNQGSTFTLKFPILDS
jgi:signal transduction histidine kinase